MKIQGPAAPFYTPSWMPPGVHVVMQFIASYVCKEPQEWTILQRLSTDPAMSKVWTELKRRDRKTKAFVHPAMGRQGSAQANLDEIQEEALGYLFFFTFRATADKISVSKYEEQSSLRALAGQRAEVLKQTAEDLEAIGPCVSAEVAALRRVAVWQEQLAETLRAKDDPLTISNDRGDRVARGLQIVLAAQLKETFGSHLHGTAAQLTTVALGLDHLQSPRVSRSAFSAGKRSEKS